MNTKIAKAQHAAGKAPCESLQRRVGAAFVSGCLALSMCPALAFAQPDGTDAQQGAPNGNPPATQSGEPQRGPQNGPQGQMGGDLDSQIRDILGPYTSSQGNGQPPEAPSGDASQQPPEAPNGDSSQQQPEAPNGANASNPPAENGQQPGEPPSGNIEDNGAPAIPDGEVNVQQIIDAIRAMLQKMNITMPEANTAGTNAPQSNNQPSAGTPDTNGEPPANAPALPDGGQSSDSDTSPTAFSHDDLVQMVLDLVNQILGTAKASA